jgi:hypothetical protein
VFCLPSLLCVEFVYSTAAMIRQSREDRSLPAQHPVQESLSEDESEHQIFGLDSRPTLPESLKKSLLQATQSAPEYQQLRAPAAEEEEQKTENELCRLR